MPGRKFPRYARTLLCIGMLAIASCGGGGAGPSASILPSLDPTYVASGHAAAGDVFVRLFEWSWSDIATECENHLGPKGYKAVLVSPPQEDINSYQWWTRYQPVSYSISLSRSGTRDEFVSMVSRCKTANVEVYVDAVINHMTAGSGVGRNGSAYSKYSYPVPYTQTDFHAPCFIYNYRDAANVQNCQLVGLADLDTSSATVQQKIADYLIDLARIGVAGYRVDAAKHINALELNEIIAIVNSTLSAEHIAVPYLFAEVIDYGGEAVSVRDYYGLGYDTGGSTDVTEFKFHGVSDKFLGTGTQRLYQLNPNGTPGNQFSQAAWGLMPSDKAVVFLENHDTQRSSGIYYRDGTIYRLANVWMLAQPYGYPSVMSSYAFDRLTQSGRDAGPPTNGPGCASSLESAVVGQWVCEHRDPLIANMVGFRKAVAGTGLSNWWDNGSKAIAFSRGDQGFVAINAESTSVTRNFTTGLAAGTYCDVLGGGVLSGVCVGNSINVGPSGDALITLPSMTGVVLQVGSNIP